MVTQGAELREGVMSGRELPIRLPAAYDWGLVLATPPGGVDSVPAVPGFGDKSPLLSPVFRSPSRRFIRDTDPCHNPITGATEIVPPSGRLVDTAQRFS